MAQVSTDNIPYDESRAINILRRAHSETLGERLRAIVLFGDLVATGNSLDITLLEVVDGIGETNIRHYTFSSTQELPLRGLLHIYFLTPDEFLHPSKDLLAGTSWSSLELIQQVRSAYYIVYETPERFAEKALSIVGGEGVSAGNPLKLSFATLVPSLGEVK